MQCVIYKRSKLIRGKFDKKKLDLKMNELCVQLKTVKFVFAFEAIIRRKSKLFQLLVVKTDNTDVSVVFGQVIFSIDGINNSN